MFGTSKACVVDQTGCSGYHRSAHLVEDIDKGQSVVALQRYCGVRALLRCQHLGEGVWELRGSYVNGRELSQERVSER